MEKEEEEKYLKELDEVANKLREAKIDLVAMKKYYAIGERDISEVYDFEERIAILRGARNYLEMVLDGEDCTCTPNRLMDCYYCRMKEYYREYKLWKS